MTNYKKCAKCHEWTKREHMDFFDEIGDVCEKCSDDIKYPKESPK